MRKEESIVIIGAARTPVGAYLGDLKTVPTEVLGAIALKEAVKRSNIEITDIDEVITGHVQGTQVHNNISRVIALEAGCKYESTAMTVNRICGSGIQSAISAYQTLLTTDVQFVAAGGAESLSRAEFFLPLETRWQGFAMGDFKVIDSNLEGHRSASPKHMFPDISHMGDTAEKLIELYSIPREDQDRFAFESQMKAKKAMENGRFAQEIIPVEIKDRKGNITVVEKDGHPKPKTTLEGLAPIKPAFRRDGKGSVTAGNASGLNDGAAYEIFTLESIAKEKGLDIIAKVVDFAIVGVDPNIMGIGPVPAIRKVLDKNNLKLEDIDFLEINEAFAGQTLACLKELGNYLDTPLYDRLNVNGGAVALGHPLGMSGARIITTLCYEFINNPNKKYAIASACIGGGQGIALLLENPKAVI
ncbi:MAG: acetyl-CoA C-acyltransferase [Firmicutes bacterium HGW-Firmicutes-19]|jgi:acetyl-CoA C-acetyltransferase|nr:MAG: acetyl-CoA C-acyltransferase [Firmicutes bacterium HGW-Firmicutes-19]